MKKTKANIFRINSPYGVIIRLSDLAYSWFNREYYELYSSSSDRCGEDAYDFNQKLNEESTIERLKEFAIRNSKYGTSSDVYRVGEIPFMRVWLYNDKNYPFNQHGEIENKMDRYLSLRGEIELILK